MACGGHCSFCASGQLISLLYTRIRPILRFLRSISRFIIYIADGPDRPSKMPVRARMVEITGVAVIIVVRVLEIFRNVGAAVDNVVRVSKKNPKCRGGYHHHRPRFGIFCKPKSSHRRLDDDRRRFEKNPKSRRGCRHHRPRFEKKSKIIAPPFCWRSSAFQKNPKSRGGRRHHRPRFEKKSKITAPPSTTSSAFWNFLQTKIIASPSCWRSSAF